MDDVPKVPPEHNQSNNRSYFPDRIGISDELRRYRFLQTPEMRKRLEEFSYEIDKPKRRIILKATVALCTASFLGSLGHLPLQVLLTSVHCPSTLGHLSLSVLYGTLAISSEFSQVLLRFVGPKIAILCGMISHVIFIVANSYPSYKTIIPASIVSGIFHGISWHVQLTLVSSLALRFSVVQKNYSNPSTRIFQTIFLIVYESACVIGNVITSIILMSASGGVRGVQSIFYQLSIYPGQDFYGGVCNTLHSWLYNCSARNTWMESSRLIFTMYSVFVVVGFLVIMFGLDPPDIIFQQVPGPPHPPTQTPWVWRRILMALFSCFSGCHQAFILGDLSKVISSTSGIQMVGFTMGCYGVVRLSWILLSHTPKILGFMTTGNSRCCVVIHVGCMYLLPLSCYIFTRTMGLYQPSLWINFTLVFVWSVCDCLYQFVISDLCQKYSLKGKVGMGFTGLRSLGLAIGLGCAPFICPVYRLWIMSGTLTLGFMAYIVVFPCFYKSCNKKSNQSTIV